MAIQRSTAICLRCPSCQARLRESSDLWGPFYVCDRCGYAYDDDAVSRPPGGRSERAAPGRRYFLPRGPGEGGA